MRILAVIAVFFLGLLVVGLVLFYRSVKRTEKTDAVGGTTIFKVLEAPDGPGTHTDKVARIFPHTNILEYPGDSTGEPVLEILGGGGQDNIRVLYEAGFRVEIPTYHHPNCPTWVDPFERLEPPLKWHPKPTDTEGGCDA